MDIPRRKRNASRWFRRLLGIAVIVAVLGGITYALARLEKAIPVVDANLVWVDTVQQGEFIRQVRGNGTLVPKTEWWIAAPGEGRVESILADPGEAIAAGQPILSLVNPVLEQSVREAEWAVSAAEANLKKQHAELNSQLLDREENVVTLDAQRTVAELEARRDRDLFANGILAQHVLDTSQAKYEELDERHKLATRRLDQERIANEAQIEAEEALLEQLRGQFQLKKDQLADLQVASNRDGVLKQVLVEEGQQVTPALSLARVARPDDLRADVRIGQNQARDLAVGLPASIDTHNGVVAGHVSRIDPAVQDGTVEVEIELDEPLPRGARPDLSVEGTIELEKVENVVHMGRPISARENAEIELFKVLETGEAVRTRVRLGRASVNRVEVLGGLAPGDRVILSDTARWDGVDRIRLR